MVEKSSGEDAKDQTKDRSSTPYVITPSTPHEYIDEFFTPFGGLFAFVKMLASLQFENVFQENFVMPSRKPSRGHFFMFSSLLFLLVIGFQRVFHFIHISQVPMLLCALGVSELPVVSTFWRWLKSCGLNQANSLLNIMAVMRERVWSQVGYRFETIHVDIDTTVETVYGDIEGARKGHNRQHRGKKGLRPILAFCAETKEYIWGKLRKGTTVSANDVKKAIKGIRPQLPGCVKKVIIRADSEFYSEGAIEQCEEEGFGYTIAVKKTMPDFDPDRWYGVRGRPNVEFNCCEYCPPSWKKARRFVAMRLPKHDENSVQAKQTELLEGGKYKYRVFVTERTKKTQLVIDEYDGRAGAEPLIGEAKREGLAAIPSKMFQNNMAFFQIVMLVYNLWRFMQAFVDAEENSTFRRHTIHVARLKLLFVAAKVTRHSMKEKIKYSMHLEAKPRLEKLFKKFDKLLSNPTIWQRPIVWAMP